MDIFTAFFVYKLLIIIIDSYPLYPPLEGGNRSKNPHFKLSFWSFPPLFKGGWGGSKSMLKTGSNIAIKTDLKTVNH
jgi:hypothetical protein